MRLAKNGSLSKSELYSRMLTASKVFLGPGVSEHQAFSRFIATDEGRELFKIQQSLPGRDVTPEWQAPIAKKDGDDSLWGQLVRATAKSQNLTISKAIDVALSTPEGRAVYADQRRFEKVHAAGFTVADMQMDDAIADIQKANRGDPVDTPSEYETAVANIMRQYPHLTQSQAHDEAQRQNPRAWEEHKSMDKLGGNRLPHGHQQSGVSPPSLTSQTSPTPRPPMWQSNHSGSYSGTTPAREPYRPDNSPSVKGFWNRQSLAAQRDYVRMLSKLARMSPASAESVLKGL
jgi:hypothetical protein